MAGYKLMRIAGIRVVVDPTWLFIFALVVVSLATGYFPAVSPSIAASRAWVLGVTAALLLFASVLVHEMSHALLARRAGIPVARIRLFLFGGVSEMGSEPADPAAELRVAAAGPATSLGLAALFGMLSRSGVARPLPEAHLIIGYLAMVNLALGVFNLLPGLPLDGGRILRAWLWRRHGNLLRATRTAGRAGAYVGYGLIGFGLITLVQGGLLAGVWMILIGAFLHRAARSSYRSALFRDLLANVRVAGIMSYPVITAPDHASLTELIDEFFLRYPHGSFPVVTEGRYAGMVSLEQVKTVPRPEWSRTPVRAVMTPAAELQPLDPGLDCVTALERLLRNNVSRLAVVAEERIVGILSLRDIMKSFRIRSNLSS